MDSRIIQSVSAEKLMRRQRYGAYVDGIDVCIVLGQKECRVSYQVALTLATMLYDTGKQAKARAGDQSIQFLGIARLTDANVDELQAQRSRDRTAVFAKVR